MGSSAADGDFDPVGQVQPVQHHFHPVITVLQPFNHVKG